MSLAARDATFRDLELRKVRPSHVEAWVKEMSMRGLAPGTVKTRFVNVRSVFRAAIRDKVIAGDPTTGIRLPASASVKPRWRYRHRHRCGRSSMPPMSGSLRSSLSVRSRGCGSARPPP
ncbi:phage integrase N-terminal domain-containing protein [Nocardioides terrisoli]|uniref:phage integrase N-terminal domain-containing protein n=1 Tax=Nocardioides terrisoli TaxID=3388267 RepID=UPI0037C60136